jgi:hypothetical protein
VCAHLRTKPTLAQMSKHAYTGSTSCNLHSTPLSCPHYPLPNPQPNDSTNDMTAWHSLITPSYTNALSGLDIPYVLPKRGTADCDNDEPSETGHRHGVTEVSLMDADADLDAVDCESRTSKRRRSVPLFHHPHPSLSHMHAGLQHQVQSTLTSYSRIAGVVMQSEHVPFWIQLQQLGCTACALHMVPSV